MGTPGLAWVDSDCCRQGEQVRRQILQEWSTCGAGEPCFGCCSCCDRGVRSLTVVSAECSFFWLFLSPGFQGNKGGIVSTQTQTILRSWTRSSRNETCGVLCRCVLTPWFIPWSFGVLWTLLQPVLQGDNQL